MKFLFLSNRSTNILQINTMLREQLDQAHLANQQLTEDLRRATTELQQIRNDFTQKSRDWKEEERVEFLEIFLFFLSKNISSGF
jgi:rootletin